MDFPSMLQAVIIFIHPLFAIGILYWMYKQYQYRSKRLELRGRAAIKYREKHEKSGVLIYRSVLVVITIGFITNSSIGFASGEGYYSLFPSSLHGWFGIMGLILLTITVNTGKTVKAHRESDKSFSFELQKHGRASDIVMILLALHAFIGFIYLFQLLIL